MYPAHDTGERERASESEREREREREREKKRERGKGREEEGGSEGGREGVCVQMCVNDASVSVSVTQADLGQSKLRLLGLSVIVVLAPILCRACCPALRELQRRCCGGGRVVGVTAVCEGLVRHTHPPTHTHTLTLNAQHARAYV